MRSLEERKLRYRDERGRVWVGYEFYTERWFKNFKTFLKFVDRKCREIMNESVKDLLDNPCLGLPYSERRATEWERLLKTGRTVCNEGGEDYRMGWEIEFEGRLPEWDEEVPEGGYGRVYLYNEWVEEE